MLALQRWKGWIRMKEKDKNTLLKVKRLTKIYTSGYFETTSVVGAKDVSFDLKKGEIISLVGESGSGKTTTAKMILRLIKPTTGQIFFDGRDAFSYDKRDYYKKVQGIFQDPYSAFNLFYKVDRTLNLAFNFYDNPPSSEEKRKIIERTLEEIGLNPGEVLGRYPHQLSGGQMQRLLVARALIIGSEVLVADEPTSMIDASSRVDTLNTFLKLKKRGSLSIIFITHDIGQAYYISDKVLIFKKGEVVEEGFAEEVFLHPKHPYTKELFASIPRLYEKWEI